MTAPATPARGLRFAVALPRRPIIALLALAAALPACGPAEIAEPVSGYMVLGGELIADLPAGFEPALAALTAGLADAGFRPPPPPRRPADARGDADAAPASPPSTPDNADAPGPFRVRRFGPEDWLLYAGSPGDALTVLRLRALPAGPTRLAVRVGSSGDVAEALRLLRAVRRRLDDAARTSSASQPDPDPPQRRAPDPA